MKKTVYICDHCGKEFNAINGYSELQIDDFDRCDDVDLCTDCYNELCNIVSEFVGRCNNE